MELLAVVTLMGIFGSLAMARYGPTLFGDFGSQAEARRISLALLQAKRRAITTGADHAVQFSTSGATTYYSVVSYDGFGVASLVDGPFAIDTRVQIVPSHSEMIFNFEGQAAAAYQVALSGDHRAWNIAVVPISGAINVAQGP